MDQKVLGKFSGDSVDYAIDKFYYTFNVSISY